jgi:photosystem II stability/assembly factor-like uncharacterized protein
LPFKAQINSFFANGTNIFAGSPVGIFSSINNGNSWSPINTGLPENNQKYSFTAVGNTVFVGTEGYGIFASTNNGATWNPANNGLTNNDISSMKTNGTFLYAGTYGGIFTSSDTGTSWTPINNGLVNTSINYLAAANGNLFALTSGSKEYSSIDNGQHWNAGFTLPCDPGWCSIVSAFIANGNNLLFGFYQHDQDPKWGTALDYGQGVSLSSDNGITFSAANTGLPLNLPVNDFANQGNMIFIGTQEGVFASNNIDFNWKAINSGLPSPGWGNFVTPVFIKNLAANETHLFANINGNGIWRAPLSSVALQSTNSNSLDQINLKVSTPSRLNPNVAVSFSLPRSEQVSVKVYNLSGREIATIVNKYLGAGTHGISWNMKDAAPGCYAVKLRAGPHEFVKKIPFPQ